jgi:hypothetical protein
MRVKRQLVMWNDQGDEETVTDGITLNNHPQRLDPLGLTLAESTPLLSTLQRHLRQQQSPPFRDPRSTCPDCGTPLKLKAGGSRSCRTLFGPWKFSRPRRAHGDGPRHKTSSCRPLSALLTASGAPELLYREAKWSALVSYGMSLEALQACLPLALSLAVKTVRSDPRKVAKRREAELGEEPAHVIEGARREWAHWPLPEGSGTVGLDGG